MLHDPSPRRRTIRAATVVAWLAAGSVLPATEPKSPVVATVNGVPILRSQLDATVSAERRRRHLGRVSGETERRFLERRALERLIERELLHQAALDAGVDVSSRRVAQQLQSAGQAHGADPVGSPIAGWDAMSEQERAARVRRQLIIARYKQRLTRKVKVGEDELRRAYERQRDRFGTPERVRVAQMVVLVPADASPAEREAKRSELERCRRRAEAGEAFDALVRECSDSPLVERGGDLGFIPRGRMRPAFDEVVFDTAVGQLTPVFEIEYGYCLAKVLDRQPALVRPFAEVKAGLRLHLQRERKREILREHVRRLRERADIEVLDPRLGEPSGGV